MTDNQNDRRTGDGITPGPHPDADATATPGPDARPDPAGTPPVMPRTEARQARTTGRVRYILTVSLGLAVLAMIIVYLVVA